MKNLTIERAGNKRFNGKAAIYNEEAGTIKIGRTVYNIHFGTYQPNIPQGDYATVNHTILTAKSFTYYKLGAVHLNSGSHVYEFKINN